MKHEEEEKEEGMKAPGIPKQRAAEGPHPWQAITAFLLHRLAPQDTGTKHTTSLVNKARTKRPPRSPWIEHNSLIRHYVQYGSCVPTAGRGAPYTFPLSPFTP